MPLAPVRLLSPSRTIRIPPRATYFNGVNAYAVVSPFTVYGWSEITVAEWFYPVWPKANNYWSKFSMIGDYWTDRPSVFWGMDNRYDYTWLAILWVTRKPDGTARVYSYNIYSYAVKQWVFTAYRFTSAREYSVYVNGVKKYSATVPADYKTVLEWNPDTATYPGRYKRFVLGESSALGEPMTMYQSMLLIYTRALSDAEIQQIYYYPYDPPRNGLVLWLDWTSLDCASGMWYDKSGFGNHATLYNVQCVDTTKKPTRVLSPVR
ncbi:MAG: hypothetical protein C0179_00670 [Fervidicoccus sp.]|nr:MAG: hypothetical protein C0179_00670 [Fervidicoccus sp.]